MGAVLSHSAQSQDVRLPTVGLLGSSTASADGPRTAAFGQRLRELGWFDGRTVAIEFRGAEGRRERFAEIAAEFVRMKVDVIVAFGGAVPAFIDGGCGVGGTRTLPSKSFYAKSFLLLKLKLFTAGAKAV